MITEVEKRYILENAYADENGDLCVDLSENSHLYQKLLENLKDFHTKLCDPSEMQFDLYCLENVFVSEINDDGLVKFYIDHLNGDENMFSKVNFYHHTDVVEAYGQKILGRTTLKVENK